MLRRLAEEQDVAETLRSPGTIRRFWEVCRLPDFRQQGAEFHARFVARLWQDLRRGELGADYVAQAIAQLDNVSGDIDTLQGRISAIRSWAYIAQRPDWVLARDEMAARARAVEARLSDALHARLTERFVNRRTAVLMKKLGPDSALLPVRVEDGDVFVEDAHIGRLRGFRFEVDPLARAGDRKLLLAAAERHLPALLAERARSLATGILEGDAELGLEERKISWCGHQIASLKPGSALSPGLVADPALSAVPERERCALLAALETWLARRLDALAPLRRLDQASRALGAGPELRALLIRLVEAGGVLAREGSGLDRLDRERRTIFARLGITVGALDLFVPAILRPAAQRAWHDLGATVGSDDVAGMPAVLAMPKRNPAHGYRALGRQQIRVDVAEKLLREAHRTRVAHDNAPFALDPARAVSTGLTTANYAKLLALGGFRPIFPNPLPDGALRAAAPPVVAMASSCAPEAE